MRQIITILILLAACTDHLYCQEPFDEALMLLEHKIYVCKNDSEKAELGLQKLDIYFAQNNFSEDALREAKRIDHSLLRDKSEEKRFLWNSSVLAYLNNDERMSLRRYNLYSKLYPDTTVHSLLLGYLAACDFDSSLSKILLNSLSRQDSAAACLSCLGELQTYKRRHKKAYVISSAIIPGLGTMLNGNVRKGFTSLAVNTGAVLGTLELLNYNLYIGAASLGASMFIKLYFGNIRLTKKVFDEKELNKKAALAKNCERGLGKILESYPIRIVPKP